MDLLIWILGSSILMSAVGWIGLILLALRESLLKRLLLPLVAFSAGSLLGGALLHLLPEALLETEEMTTIFLWTLVGFSLFFLMEQFLSWHHHHAVPSEHKEPFTYLILLADSLHNFIGGLAIAGSFLISIEAGIVTWIAAAAHEIPQELGDFGILVRGGWKKYQALLVNFISALTIVPGALLAYFLSAAIDVTFLLPFAAGNFIYIAASDLVPEIKHERDIGKNLVHFTAFVAGISVIFLTRLFVGI